jgi:hypothetical protein
MKDDELDDLAGYRVNRFPVFEDGEIIEGSTQVRCFPINDEDEIEVVNYPRLKSGAFNDNNNN